MLKFSQVFSLLIVYTKETVCIITRPRSLLQEINAQVKSVCGYFHQDRRKVNRKDILLKTCYFDVFSLFLTPKSPNQGNFKRKCISPIYVHTFRQENFSFFYDNIIAVAMI